MACGYCSATPVSPCPVCEVRPVTQTLRRVSLKASGRPAIASPASPVARPVPAPIVVPAPSVAAADPSRAQTELETPAVVVAPKASRVAMAEDCRTWASQGKQGWAIFTMASLASPERKAERCAALRLIDENAATRGYLSARDNALRESIAAACVRELGYDPRTSPAPIPLVKLAAAPKVPPSAPLAKLFPGEWEELNRRVASGSMTREQGLTLKAEWDALAKATDDILADLVAAKA